MTPITALGSRYGIQGALGRSVKRASTASTWWDLNGTITSCVAAYQPKGAASYAASLTDLSGNGYDIDDGTDPSFNTGTGWYFDGVDDYLFTSTFPINNGDFTIAAFINPTIAHNNSSVICSSNSYNGSTYINGWMAKSEQYDDTGKIGYSVRKVGDYASSITPPSSDFVVVFTRSGTSVNIYMGASNWSTTTGPMNYISANGLYIGARMTTTACDFYKNYMYAIALYDTVLTTQNISDLSTAMAAL